MRDVSELEERLAEPRPALVEDLHAIDGDILVLGAAGKLGPSLTRLAVAAARAAGSDRRVVAVSRFGGTAELQASLEADGAETVAADIGDDRALDALPDAPNVIYLVGAKFGTEGNQTHTWHTNVVVPSMVATRYRESRVVALSTGNVYPFVGAGSGGCEESTPPDPVGEYAATCLGRERAFQHAADRYGTRSALIRLNYAVEMRYGVLVDLASALLAGDPVDVTMGQVNVVWQGYANEVILRALRLVDNPPALLNLTGPETVSVRQVAGALAAALGVEPRFVGEEAETALLSNAAACFRHFGYPDITLSELVELTASWMKRGGPTHHKATGFQRRDGRF
jgi:nucleoside-diphosphate-sugar epimerase